MTKYVNILFEITNTLSFEERVEVDEGADEDDIREAAEQYAECLNWGDLDQMFNMAGPPEFNIDLYEEEEDEDALPATMKINLKGRLVSI